MIINNTEIDLINQAIIMEKKINKQFNMSKEVFSSSDEILALSCDEIDFICICLGNLLSVDDNFSADDLISKLISFIDNKR